MVVSLLALGLLAAASAPALAASHPPAQTAKKKKCKKKGKKSARAAKKKCQKKAPGATVPAPPAPPSGGATTTPPPPPPPPPNKLTTDQLIDAAVASGTISPEQGLIYKVFAAFSDPRLPSQYVGVPDPLAEAPLDDVTAQWDQLSDGAKATLGPFLIPPMHEGSYWEQLISGASAAVTPAAALASPRAAEADPNSPWCQSDLDIALQDWSYVEAASGSADGKVRIWYQNRYAATDAALAGNLMSAMANKIWPKLTTLMGREPLPDFGSTGACAGGSDAVDIALVDAAKATTTPTLRQEDSPAHMIFPRTGSGGTTPFLAHEFMHMIQYSFNLASGDVSSGENQWLKEGTAQWAQDYVSSSHYGIGLTPDQTEHQALDAFFPFPEKSLDSTSTYRHDYGSYVFWLWAARKGNNPNIVGQVWNAVGTQKSLNAAKSIFGSGWAQAWKDFARANWNKDPVGDYQDWDDIHQTPAIAAAGNLPNNEVTPVTTFVAPVAAKYLRFVPNPNVGVLTYRNNGSLSDEAGIQAIISYKDGSKAVEDWTQVAEQDVPFCNIEELTMVVSNASVTPSDSKLFNLTFAPPSSLPHTGVRPRAANVCVPDPQGSFSGSAHYDDTVTTIVDWSWSGDVDFDPFGQMNPWFPDYFTEVWDSAMVESGSVTLSGSGTVDGSDGECSIDIPAATYQLDAGTMAIQPGPEPHYGIQLGMSGTQFPQATISCPDEDPQTGPFPGPALLIYTENPEQTMTRGTYQGSSTFNSAGYASSYSWNLSDP
jgi:hypothetical protein